MVKAVVVILIFKVVAIKIHIVTILKVIILKVGAILVEMLNLNHLKSIQYSFFNV